MIELTNVNTEDCVTVPRNSDFQEHSRNLLESVAGEAQDNGKPTDKDSAATKVKRKNEHPVGTCTYSTANVENILKTRGYRSL